MPLYLEYHGFNAGLLIRSHYGTLNTDRFGLDTATAEWKCQQDHYNLAPDLDSQHPIWSWLYMEKRRVEIAPEGFLITTGEYCGISGGRTPSVYEASYGSSEEKIEAHPDFVTTIAGTASSPKHGAIFVDKENSELVTTNNDRGIFSGFLSIIDGAKNPFAAVTSFLSPQVTLRETWISTSPVSAANIGKISSPPFSVTIEGNWLFTGASFQQRSRVYSNTREWRASGRHEWNTSIYG